MIKEIIHDPLFLAQKSEAATKNDLHIVKDLVDTLFANKEGCVGMAANMIGERKRIIAFDNMGIYMTMLNPEIIEKNTPYDAEEGCLSLLGCPRKTIRYQNIKVRYQTTDFKWQTKAFSGWTAQIIQHEIDHCNGILI